MKARLVAAVALLGAGTFGLSACKVSVSTGTRVAKDVVEKEVTDQLTAKVGVAPKSVTCPSDLKAKVDQTLRCTLAADDGTEYGLTVTVTKVDGTKVDFDIQVDDTPSTSGTASPTTT